MNIRPITENDRSVWPGCDRRTMVAPPGMDDDVAPAGVLVGGDEIHVPWQPDELDVAALAHGGTVWLTVLGGLPLHRIQVSEREAT